MKLTASTTVLLLFPIMQASADVKVGEVTNLAHADWTSPLATILVIFSAIILARIIRTKHQKPTIDNNAN